MMVRVFKKEYCLEAHSEIFTDEVMCCLRLASKEFEWSGNLIKIAYLPIYNCLDYMIRTAA